MHSAQCISLYFGNHLPVFRRSFSQNLIAKQSSFFALEDFMRNEDIDLNRFRIYHQLHFASLIEQKCKYYTYSIQLSAPSVVAAVYIDIEMK